MAKERKTNTSVSAFDGLLETIGAVAKVELKDNPEELAKVNKMVADVKDSNIMTGLELQDDAIGAMHDADDAATEAEHQAEVAEADANARAIEQADADLQAADEQVEPTE